MAAPALPTTLGLRFAAPPPRPPEHRVASAVAGAGASGLLVLLVSLGVAGVGAYGRLARPDAASAPPERVTFVDADPRPLPIPEPVGAPVPGRSRTPTLPPLAAPAVPAVRSPGAAAPGATGSVPATPPAPLARDTAAVRAVPGAGLPPPPRAVLPGDRIAFPPPPVGRAPDGVRAGVATGPVPLDSAQRAQRLLDISAGIVAAARRRGAGLDPGTGVATAEPPADRTRPQAAGGVSIAVPLPGGGPSAAERRRNRELDAEVRAGLARVRARVDSLRADSLRRADSTRAPRRPPG